jgi:hypothetical protein
MSSISTPPLGIREMLNLMKVLVALGTGWPTYLVSPFSDVQTSSCYLGNSYQGFSPVFCTVTVTIKATLDDDDGIGGGGGDTVTVTIAAATTTIKRHDRKYNRKHIKSMDIYLT